MTSRLTTMLVLLGVLWMPAEAQFWTVVAPYSPAPCLATNSKNMVFWGSPTSQVIRSTDRGATWTEHQCGPGSYQLVDNIEVGANDVLYATVEGSYYGKGGLYRSTNDGLGWQDITRNINRRTEPSWYSLDVSTEVVDTTTHLLVNTGVDLQFSDDGGQTFIEIPTPDLLAQRGSIRETFLSPNSEKMFVSVFGDNGNTWYYSADRGNTWMEMIPDSQPSERDGYACMRADRNGLLYLGRGPMLGSIYSQGAVVMRSSDDGESWEYLLDGWDTSYVQYSWIAGIAFGHDRDVWVVTKGLPGVVHSTDGGEHWITVNEGVTPGQEGHDIAVTPDGYVFLSRAATVYVHRDQPTSVNADLPAIIRETTGYPNPVHDQVFINFDLASEALVRIDVMSVGGEQVATSYVERHGVGRHTVSFATTSLAPGLYIWAVATQGETKHGSFVVTN